MVETNQLQPYFGGEERTEAELTLVNPPVLRLEDYDRGWKSFLPVGANRDHPACRVLGPLAKDLSHVALPASLVVIAEMDVCRDWGKKYCEGLRELGKNVQEEVFTGAYHGFHMDPDHPEAPRLFAIISRFKRKVAPDSQSIPSRL